MRKEEVEEQFNKEMKQGWKFAADAVRITDESAGSEDCKQCVTYVRWSLCGN